MHRAKTEIGQRTVGRRLRPVADLANLLEFLRLVEQAVHPLERILQPPQTEVIPPTLDQHGRKLQRNDAVQKRNVLLQQLLLQTDRMRRNDNPKRPFFLSPFSYSRPSPLAPLPFIHLLSRRGQNGGNQVGETLAHAGAGLDDQMVPFADRAIDRLGHCQLLGPLLVMREPGGNPPGRAQDLRGSVHRVKVPEDGGSRKGEGGRGKMKIARFK